MKYIIYNSEKYLIFEQYKSSIVVKDGMCNKTSVIAENVTRFCAVLDKNSNVHIFFFTSDRKLKHAIYDNKMKISNIEVFTTYDNLDYMKAVILQGKINLFYIVNSAENKLDYIYNCYYTDESWKINKISKIDSVKKNSDYCVKCYMDELYLFFVKEET